MKFDIKKLLPHILVLVAFALISLVYNAPVLEGKKLKQEDMTQVQGMSKEVRDFNSDPANKGEVSLWTNALFCGMPTYQILAPKPGMWITTATDFLTQLLPQPASIVVLLLICFYFLGILMGFPPLLSAFGAIAFAFSSYNFIIIDVGHVTKTWAIAFMAPVVGGLITMYRGKYIKGFAIFTVGMALELSANHFQITYYLGIMLLLFGFYQIIEAYKTNKLPNFSKATGLAILGVLIAVGANYTNLSITDEFGKETMRGNSELKSIEGKKADGLDLDYAFGWSYGVAETGTILIPNFNGGATVSKLGKNSAVYKAMAANNIPNDQIKSFTDNAPAYFGTQPSTAGPTYFGALVVFLFVFGMFFVENRLKWWLFSVVILASMLSWGKNFMVFNEFVFNNFPLYNKFRAVSMTLTLASFCVPLLACLGIYEVLNNPKSSPLFTKSLKYSTIITGGFCLLFIIMPGLFFDFSSPFDSNFKDYPWLLNALLEDRESLLRSDAIRSLFLILAGAGLLWAFVTTKIKGQTLLFSIAIITLLDLWIVDKRYLNADDYVSKAQIENPFEPNAADIEILKDPALYYRVLDVTGDPFNDNRCSYFHKSVGGYNPAKLARYEDIKQRYIAKMNLGVLSMLNTKYIITSEQQGGQPRAERNMGAMGNAWFVKDFKLVGNAKVELDSLSNINPSEIAYIDERYSDVVKNKVFIPDASNSIQLKEYKPNKLTFESNTVSDQLAIFSDVYYDKGWKVKIDGKPSEYIRANYLLRAMIVPTGKHTIEFYFEPDTYVNAERVSLASSILLILVVLGSLFSYFRKKKPTIV